MTDYFACQTWAILIGFILDFFLGDPPSFPHPVRLIGRFIAFLDGEMRYGENDERDLKTGTVTTVLTVVIITGLSFAILFFLYTVNPNLYLIFASIACWQLLSARQLMKEAQNVKNHLIECDTEGARQAVSMIVGRDTERLDEAGITRAAVETVAENTSDGVIAPLFWMLFFGPVGGFFYKSINTLDSMIGYKNDKYIYFGRAAAKFDDVVNFFPSRLSACLMIAVTPLLKLNYQNARYIFKRDRHKHDSPNSAQTESVCAGALGVRLAGNAYYEGVLHKKEYIGDPIREIEPKDIDRACGLMYASSALMLLLVLIIRNVVNLCC